MYASVRQYRSSDVAEVARRAQDGFVPIARQIPGMSGWYLIDGGGGVAITVTLCESESAAEESVSRAREWVQANVPDLIEGTPDVTNGEVRAQT